MPLLFEHLSQSSIRLAIWEITEPEAFFLNKVRIERSIHHPQKRLQHSAGRFLLPYLYPDFPISEIQVEDNGRPSLPNNQYRFSISHCKNYAAAIVSPKRRVGIDIEIASHRVLGIARKFLGPAEINWVKNATANPIEGSTSSDRVNLVTLLWCAKESVYKWWGNGEVSFSAQIKIDPFTIANEGRMQAIFENDGASVALSLEYRFFNGLCLVWVETFIDHPFL